MIVSRALKYVYIAIPRTGSKSMSKWLVDHFQGEWVGEHHAWRVPEEYRSYHVFTVVRNPYEIQASGWFFQPVIDPPHKPESYAEACRQWRCPADQPASQKQFIEWSGVSQIVYFEHLPDGLAQLPFVDPDHVPPFPHLNAGGYRPPGDFFQIMADGDEALVWNGLKDDFTFLGYERFNSGAPATPNQKLQLTGGARDGQ